MGDTHPAALSNHTSTQQHAATKPRFIITGFGRFCGVAQNPTEQLVNWLQSKGCHTAAGQHDSQQHYCISSLDVLEVSADAVDSFMQKQQEMLVQQHASAPANGEGPQPVVLLHFGVDTQRPAISLELQAYNNATFSCPDQAGWQPKACLIEAAPGLGTSSVRTTCLPLQELVQQLRDAGFECGVSRDAGRFVCNYTYYKSLQMTSKLQQQLVVQKQQQQAVCAASTAAAAANGNGSTQPAAGSSDSWVAASQTVEQRRAAAVSTEHGWPCFSLFVHMPSFEVVNQVRQREFVMHLLDLVAKWVAGGGQQHQQQQQQQVAAT